MFCGTTWLSIQKVNLKPTTSGIKKLNFLIQYYQLRTFKNAHMLARQEVCHDSWCDAVPPRRAARNDTPVQAPPCRTGQSALKTHVAEGRQSSSPRQNQEDFFFCHYSHSTLHVMGVMNACLETDCGWTLQSFPVCVSGEAANGASQGSFSVKKT